MVTNRQKHIQTFQIMDIYWYLKILIANLDDLKIWTVSHEKTCTTFCLVVRKNTFTDIENYSNTSEAYYFLESNLKSLGSGFLNYDIEKLFFVILNKYYVTNYITKFQAIL